MWNNNYTRCKWRYRITLASGASQTGFGRTGTVDWDTTSKTATFTAVMVKVIL